jgi:hypothetical protein
MLAEVARPVGSEDLKLDLHKPRRESGLPLEQTRFAGIIQTEFIQNLIAINPLSPYLKLI